MYIFFFIFFSTLFWRRWLCVFQRKQGLQGCKISCIIYFITFCENFFFFTQHALAIIDMHHGMQIWSLKFQPITKKSLLLHYSVDPVGTELMWCLIYLSLSCYIERKHCKKVSITVYYLNTDEMTTIEEIASFTSFSFLFGHVSFCSCIIIF